MDRKRQLVMYLHGGSGNHGCEAIVNGTCRMTEGIPKLLVTNSEEEDRFYSLAPLCDILQENKIAEHFFPAGAEDQGTLFCPCMVLCMAGCFS